ncbi:MAG: hypothetical protein IKV82_08470 [Akkermansia sp.]|nr:hypothetical protein [Akkermansia sp.]
MRSCLGGLILMLTIVALIATVIYHTSVNSELRFEPRDANAEYINTRRSYRPQIKREDDKTPDAAKKAHATPAIQDDETAEEVAP